MDDLGKAGQCGSDDVGAGELFEWHQQQWAQLVSVRLADRIRGADGIECWMWPVRGGAD